MNNPRGALVAVGAVALLILVCLSVVRQAVAASAQELAQARVALLGRWGLADPSADGATVTLDFHAGETGRYRCDHPGGSVGGPVAFAVQQETLRRRVLDVLLRRPAVRAVYVFRTPRVPARSVLGPLGTTWHGTLLGDGNVLALFAPPRPALVLRRRGAG